METESNKKNEAESIQNALSSELNENERQMLKEDGMNPQMDDNKDQEKSQDEEEEEVAAEMNNNIADKEQSPTSKIQDNIPNDNKDSSIVKENDTLLNNKDSIVIENKDNAIVIKEKEDCLEDKDIRNDNNQENKTDNKEPLAKEKEDRTEEEAHGNGNSKEEMGVKDNSVISNDRKPTSVMQPNEEDNNQDSIQLSILQKNSEIISLSKQREQYQIELNNLLTLLNNVLIKASSILNQQKQNPQTIKRLEYQLLSHKKTLQQLKSQNKIFKEQYEMLTLKSQGSSLEKIGVLEYKIEELQQDNSERIKRIRDLRGTQNVKSKELEGYSANVKFPKEIKAYTEELKTLTNKKREYYMKLNQNKKIISTDLLQVAKIEELYQKMREMTNLPHPLPTGRIEYEINRIKYDLKGNEEDIIKRIDQDDMMIVQEKLRKEQWFSPQINTKKKYLDPISADRLMSQLSHHQDQAHGGGESIKVNKSSITNRNKSPMSYNKKNKKMKIDPYQYFIEHKNKKFITAKDKQSDIIDIYKLDDQDISKITYETLTDYEYRELAGKKGHYYDIIFKLENSVREAKKMYERKIKDMNTTIEANSKRLIYIEQENELLRSEINDLSKISRLNVEEKQMRNDIKDTSNKILRALQRDQNLNQNQQSQNNLLAKNEVSESRNEILNELDILNNLDADNQLNNNHNHKYKYHTGVLEEDGNVIHSGNVHCHLHKNKIKFTDISNVENIENERISNRDKVLKDIKSKYIRVNQMNQDDLIDNAAADDDNNGYKDDEEGENNDLNSNDYEENKENDKQNEEMEINQEELKRLASKELKEEGDEANKDNDQNRRIKHINNEEDIVNHQGNYNNKEEEGKKIVYIDQREGNDFKQYEEIDFTTIDKNNKLKKESNEINLNPKYNDGDLNYKEKENEGEGEILNANRREEEHLDQTKTDVNNANESQHDKSNEVNNDDEVNHQLTEDINEEQITNSMKEKQCNRINTNEKQSILDNNNTEEEKKDNEKEQIKENEDHLKNQTEKVNDTQINKDNSDNKEKHLDDNQHLDNDEDHKPIGIKDKEEIKEEEPKNKNQIENKEENIETKAKENPNIIDEEKDNNTQDIKAQNNSKEDQLEQKQATNRIDSETNVLSNPILEVKEDNQRAINEKQEKAKPNDDVVTEDNKQTNSQIPKEDTSEIRDKTIDKEKEEESKAIEPEINQDDLPDALAHNSNEIGLIDNKSNINQEETTNNIADDNKEQKEITKEQKDSTLQEKH